MFRILLGYWDIYVWMHLLPWLWSALWDCPRYIHYSMFRGVVTTFISQLRLSFTRSAIAGIINNTFPDTIIVKFVIWTLNKYIYRFWKCNFVSDGHIFFNFDYICLFIKFDKSSTEIISLFIINTLILKPLICNSFTTFVDVIWNYCVIFYLCN